jgi:hypothetical protein
VVPQSPFPHPRAFLTTFVSATVVVSSCALFASSKQEAINVDSVLSHDDQSKLIFILFLGQNAPSLLISPLVAVSSVSALLGTLR